jgi:hypothetical protein
MDLLWYTATRMPCAAHFTLLTLLWVAFVCPTVRAQQTCPNPPALTPTTARNIFTPQQEVDLGDVEAEMFERNVHVIHDDELSAYANRVASDILAHLPPNDLKIRVILIDLPTVNAFSIAGGRIYVARKAIAFVHNEDELAGLLGHEMGHVLTHQAAIEMTRMFHDVLGVTSVGDRKDIFDKFNQFLDNAARNPKALAQTGREEEPHQYEADQVALYAVAQASYSPESFVSFFDRLARTQGKTGNWLTDFLGETKPNEKRLRELHQTLDALPPPCRNTAAPPSDAFLAWQANVIAFTDLGRDERLTGLLRKERLDPPLRTDITQLKFSPNGRYVLAQDESSILIFTTDPLDLLMRIDAHDARPAQFTQDSEDVVFDTRGMRVEKWNIADARRVDVHEMAIPGGCIQTQLSHNGKTLACLDANLSISLLDVASANAIFSKKESFKPDQFGPLDDYMERLLVALDELSGGAIAHMAFSPDDRYFVGGLLRKTLAVDVASHSVVPMHGDLPNVVGWGSVFLANDRLMGLNRQSPNDSGIFEFPSGHLVQRFPVGPEHFESPTRSSNIVIVKPFKDSKAALVDLQTRKVLLTFEFSAAVDVYDQDFVIERKTGDVALYDLTTHKLKSEAALPRSPLGNLQAWAVSPDFRWLAVSGQTRGAVWDLLNSRRVYFVRGFRGAYFDDKNLYADFPKLDKQERGVAQLALQKSSVVAGSPIMEKTIAHQYGPYLLVSIPGDKNGSMYHNVQIEVRDVRDSHVLWTRTFPKAVPGIVFSREGSTATLEWNAEADEAQDEIKGDAALKTRFDSIRDRTSAFLLEVLDSSTGKTTGRVLIDTGKRSFRITSATTVQDWVLVADAENRIHVYSLSAGLEKGVVFGSSAAVSASAGILAVENEPGQVDIYHLPGLEKDAPLVFPFPVSAAAFSTDGKQLFVLTANQTAYVLETSGFAQPAPAK